MNNKLFALEEILMIGILVATHGKFAEGILSAAKMIVGQQSQVSFVEFAETDSIDGFKDRVYQSLKSFGKGTKVLAFCDMFGASPYNVLVQNYPQLNKDIEYQVFCGVNLPILIEALLSRNQYQSLDDFTKHLQQMAAETIKIQNFDFYKKG